MLLFFIILVQGILEVLGVASILPFMQILSNPEIVRTNDFFVRIHEIFGFSSDKHLLIFIGIACLCIIVFKNLIGILSTWLKFKYTWDSTHIFSLRLLRYYLAKPYSFFLNQNTSNLSTFILGEAGTVANGVIVPSIEVISGGLVSLFILSLLLVVDVKVTLTMFGVLSTAYVLLYLSRKNHMSSQGSERLRTNKIRFRSITELFSGIKSIMSYNKEPYFYNRFKESSRVFCDIQPRFNFVLSTPKFFLEIFSFGAIISITIYLFFQEGNIQSALPKLTLYALAGYRLIPALQTIFSSAAKIKHNYPSFENIRKELLFAKRYDVNKIEQPGSIINFEKDILFKDVSFNYEESDKLILKSINFRIKKGDTVAFIGSTGSGKTTLIDLIMGLLHSCQGNLEVDGIPLEKEFLQAWREKIAYVPQDIFLFDDTIANNVTLGLDAGDINKSQLEKSLKLANIYDFIDTELPNKIDTIIGENGVRLSGGQRQRLGLARALFKNPDVLILDEATSALDRVTENEIIASLDNLPKEITKIIVAHRLATVKHADCIYILDQGKIIDSGSYDDLLKRNKSFQNLIQIS